MSNKKLEKFMKIWGTTLILYIIVLAVYFLWFHNPQEVLPDPSGVCGFEEVNKFINDSNTRKLIYFMGISFGLCYAAAISILRGAAPVVKVRGKLLSKKFERTMGIVSRSCNPVMIDLYSLTFQLENGEEKTFEVTENHYMTILEGNKGIVTYKRGIEEIYIGFYITEVE